MRQKIKMTFIIWKTLALLLLAQNLGGAVSAASPDYVFRRFKVTAYCSCAKCCGRHSPQRGGKGLTSLGNAPIAFRTVAVGDPALLGRWLWFDDLGGWVYASDTGTGCSAKSAKRIGCVSVDQIDVFVGGADQHHVAVKLGVQEWVGKYVPRNFDPGSEAGAAP
jgi:hypothetical protein